MAWDGSAMKRRCAECTGRGGRGTECAEGHGRLREHNGSAGNLPEVVGSGREGIGVRY